ncbi:alpha/beta family hydrolase [Frankia sp. QA3]|uniref:alpha/beta hydrolase family protein n=1 Tax=Frankia sp. QA3 TaxID=710111 RepID=UPI000269CE80|nr:alpha/beta family hydrolase [Frankia sp. QA3]EIV95763.1 alpha/beta hydrolase superfamily enzyme, predicted hydrolase [Frankia sp. QA3]
MRGKSHTRGGSLTDSTLDHAVSFPAVSDRCTPAPPPPDAGAEPAPVDGACIAVDGGRLRVVPGTGASIVMFLHGAGSGVDTPLFDALAARLGAAGVGVARLEMPYRVAGRRAPDRPARLDAVAIAAVEALGTPRPLALAGVSMGSRVAVRVAAGTGARGVLALGFPLQPPGTTAAGRPKPSRQEELDGAGVPVLVVQGDRDSFGRPAPDPALDRRVSLVAGGDHSFRTRVRDGRPAGEAVAEAARVGAAFLLDRLGPPAPARESAAG